MKISIAAKLILSFLIIILVTGIIYIVVGVHIIDARVVEQAQEKVRNDLNSARVIYMNTMEHVNDIVRFTADSLYLKDAILSQNLDHIAKKLNSVKEHEKGTLDILTLTDRNGFVILRTDNITIAGDNQSQDEIIKEVLLRKEPVVATTIISKEELKRESDVFAQKAYFKFIDTPKARLRNETDEKNGMMIKAAAPVFDYDKNLIGILYGGIILDRNYEIVDKIKQTVYQNLKYKNKDIGTATIFQDDLRISTNVLNQNGSRAIGTRVSEDVYNQVVLRGQQWIGRAYVVNNWYITAYEPIKSIRGDIIGILYVGILEDRFTDIKRQTILALLGITCIGLIISFLLSFFLSRNISVSTKKLVSASKQMASGNLNTKVHIQSNDELSDLAENFNSMASALRKRDEELKEFAKKRIMESERLAIVGQLAAGVAHEMNNPIQGILTYSHLLLEKAPNGDPSRISIEKIAKQATRCREIIRGLLDFSRQSQPHVRPYDVNSILEESISLLENQASFQNIKLLKYLDKNIPLTAVDPSQIQQVFMNIIINAAEAMNGHGSITLTSRKNSQDEFVEIEFADTGHGIREEDFDHIFDPFFTTKDPGHGTGLGLAISYGIIKKHQGTIEVESRVGKGTTFIIRLPVVKD